MKYDLDYYENMLRLYSHTAKQINEIRWKFISSLNPSTVLDYGSGVGWFRAWRPKGVKVFSHDIAPAFPQTGIDLRIYDIVCFWDVLEHIDDFRKVEPVLALAKAVAATLPIAPTESESIGSWKHFKPGEHLHYFTERTLTSLFDKYGFRLLEKGQPECPPREDVTSFLFVRKEVA